MNVLSLETQAAVIGALCEGMSIRSVERLTGVHRDTIMRLGARVGANCEALHDVMFCNLNTAQIQIDELWAYIGKKQRRLKPTDAPELGDCYTFTALDATGKAIISYRTGKRDGDTARAFLTDLRARVIVSPIMSSDGFPSYENLVAEIFGKEVHYGQIIKRYVGEPHKDAARRYSPGKVVGVERTAIIGKPPRHLIGTNHIERANLTVRMSSRRFTRLTNAFSKKLDNHRAAVSLFIAHYNFCRVHETIKTTPAVELGIADHVWTIATLIRAAELVATRPQGRQVGRFRVIDGGG
jgi:IS1 family transposase